uniref:Pkinase_C domain-containing protein n=1 Tax=Echinostoma caproni TaxID=27848 RepID=A0A183B637_9TREM
LDPRLDIAAKQFLTGQELPSSDVHRASTVTKNALPTPPSFDPIRPTVEPSVHGSIPWSQRRDMTGSNPSPHYQQQQQHHFVRPLDDDDKYKRRVALGGLARLFSVRISSYFKPSHLRRPRTILSLLLVFVLLIVLLQHMHRSDPADTRGDPFFDPHMNPNIHLDEHAAAAIHGGVKFNPELNG